MAISVGWPLRNLRAGPCLRVSAPGLRLTLCSTSTKYLHRICHAPRRHAPTKTLVCSAYGADTNWQALRVLELKAELKRLGLPQYGPKEELISRLRSYYSPGSEDDEAQPGASDTDENDEDGEIIKLIGKYDEVTVKELQGELQKLGAPFSGSKRALYNRLIATLKASSYQQPQQPAADLSESEMAEWLLDRGMVPQGSAADMAVMVEAGRVAEAASSATNPLPPSSFPQPTMDLSYLTVAELKAMLRNLNLPQTGTKKVLIERLQLASEMGNRAAQPYRPPSDDEEVADESEDPDVDMRTALTDQASMALSQEISQLGVLELQEMLLDRGLSIDGKRVALENRLFTALRNERAAEPWDEATAAFEDALNADADFLDDEEGGEPQGFSLASWRHMLLGEDLPNVRVAVIAGGPSGEASVSINSARTLMDMLQTVPYPEQAEQLRAFMEQDGADEEDTAAALSGIHVDVYYIDSQMQGWAISPAQLYSNTPDDFEFKLPLIATAFDSLEAMAAQIKETAHVAFPAVHGAFGEDGELQSILQAAGVEYVGSDPASCATAFSKRSAHQRLGERGFPVLVQEVLRAEDFDGDELKEEATARLAQWMATFGMELEATTLVVKPSDGGSSLHVSVHEGLTDAVDAAKELFALGITAQVVIEPKVLGGMEFTVVVIDTDSGPVALPPSTIEIVDYADDIHEAERDLVVSQIQQRGVAAGALEIEADKSDATLFSFRRKYLPTNQIRTHTPPQLPPQIVQSIRRAAERAFIELGLRDMARIDGWVLVDSENMFLDLTQRWVAKMSMRAPLNPGPEDPSPGAGPLEDERPFLKGGLPDEEVYATGPRWNDEAEPPEEVVFVEATDRFYNISHLDQLEDLVLDQAQRELIEEGADPAEVQRVVDAAERRDSERESGSEGEGGVDSGDEAAEAPSPPMDPVKLFRGDWANAEIHLMPTPDCTLTQSPEELCSFGSGVIVFTDVNPTSGMEQNSFLFQQAAAVGLSHTSVLRHVVSRALERSGLDALPAPVSTPQLDHAELLAEALREEATMAGRLSTSSNEPEGQEGDDDLDDVDDLAGFGEDEAPDAPQQRSALQLNDLDDPPNAEALSDAPADAPGKTSQKVYVLCGGNSSERQVSLSSGVTVWLQLSRYADLDVTLYVLAPQHAGIRERSRRRELLEKRNEHLLLGIPEDKLPFELSLLNIHRPADSVDALEHRMVWEVPSALALKHSCEEIVEACETLLAVTNTADTARSIDGAASRELIIQTQWELHQMGVQGVGDGFGTRLAGPKTETMDFEAFAYRAQASRAVVFNALHGDIGENGELQSYLSHYSIAYTGSGALTNEVCVNKMETARQLEPLAGSGVYVIPKLEYTADDLTILCVDPNQCPPALENMREALGLETDSPLCIKPSSDGCSFGVARLDNESDLFVYASAVTEEWEFIPTDLLSGAESMVEMPTEKPWGFLVEPFLLSDSLVLTIDDEGARQVEHISASGFIEVTIGLYGVRGSMQAMTPSITVKGGPVLTLEEKFQSGAGINLTPPPEELVPSEVLQVARQRAELVANALQLHGMARIDAFMSIEDGTLFVIEVNTVPGLTPATVLFHQALAEDPPIYPNEFLRMQVLIALSSGAAKADNTQGDGFDDFLNDGYFDSDSPSEDDIDARAEWARSGWASQPGMGARS